MEMINYYIILLVVFSMVALGEVFKLKKEVRKLNKVTDFLLKNSQEKSKEKLDNSRLNDKGFFFKFRSMDYTQINS